MNNTDFEHYVKRKVKQLEDRDDQKKIDRIHTLEDGCKRLRARISNPAFMRPEDLERAHRTLVQAETQLFLETR